VKKIVLTKEAPAPIGPYSQAVAMGPLLFCSGQIAIDPITNELSGDIREQTEKLMKNIEAVLKANEMNFSHVVKTTIFLTDMKDFSTVNEIYGRFFPQYPPARSTVAVAALPKNAKVEVEVTAHR